MVRGRAVRCRYRGGTNGGIPARSARMTCISVSAPQGAVVHCGRARVALFSVILAKRGSPGQGQGSTLLLPWWNQRGDSRAERENDSRVSVRCRYRGGTIWGIASSQSPLDSASALRRKLRPLPCSSFSAAIRFAGFASEAGVVACAPSE